MEGIVLSFLYSLIMSMGLTGASYAEIEQAFPDNTAAQNQVLYSVANDPLQNSGGFQFAPTAGVDGSTGDVILDELLYPLNPYRTLPNSPNNGYLGSESARANWDALMAELGFYVVANNVDVAVDNGFSVGGIEWTGTLTNGENTLIVSFVGFCDTAFRSDNIPDNVGFHAGLPVGGERGKLVWRWSYGDNIIYSSTRDESLSTSNQIAGHYQNCHFYTENNRLYWSMYNPSAYWGPETYIYEFTAIDWAEQGFIIDNIDSYVPVDSEVVGEEYLSFGTAENPVVNVAYDPSTGITTYTYKDGTVSTTPPVAIGDTIALSPSITQPLTNYIINEGDITNIYNPDAAIPSADVPFDFLSLGELLKQMFIPTVAFPYMTIYNRLMNKATFINSITLIGARLKNITPQRPEFYLYGVDVFGWIDTMGDTFTYAKNFIGFVFKIMMFFGCVNLIMRTFHVEVKG